jgi:MoxR-like ATPase
MGYPSFDAEKLMLERSGTENPLTKVKQVISLEEVVELQEQIPGTQVIPRVREYIIQIVSSTRKHKDFLLGCGPRATKGLFRASQALAAMSGRKFVLPDDVKKLYPSILNHRIILSVEGRLQKRSIEHAVEEAVGMVPAPILKPESFESEN